MTHFHMSVLQFGVEGFVLGVLKLVIYIYICSEVGLGNVKRHLSYSYSMASTLSLRGM